MTVEIFSKDGCKKCVAAKEKLSLMGIRYAEHDLAYHIAHHEGWREDGSAEIMAAHTVMDTLPLFRLDGKFHDYPGAMKELRVRKATAAEKALD